MRPHRLTFEVTSEEELRGLYQAISKAHAGEVQEVARLAGLRVTGYGSEDTYGPQIERARSRRDILDRLRHAVATDMGIERVNPWE